MVWRCGRWRASCAVSGAAPQDGSHPGDQLSRRKRLGDVVVCTQFEAHHAVYFVAAGRQKHHRYLRATHRLIQRLEAFEELEAVQVGQSDVEDGERRALFRELRDGFFGRGAPHRLEAVAAQNVLERVGDARFVFGNQDPGFEAHPANASEAQGRPVPGFSPEAPGTGAAFRGFFFRARLVLFLSSYSSYSN